MRVITTTVLAMSFLFPAAALAQAGPPDASQQGPPSPGRSAGKPANLCQELLAFVHQPDPAQKADAQPAQLATAVQAPKTGSEESKPSGTAGAPQQTSGQSGQIPNSGPGAAGPQGQSQNAAAPSGATANVAPNPQSAPQAQGQPAPQPAPAQPAAPKAPKPTAEAIQKVEQAAAGNDLQSCRAVGQQMRRAGVAVPAPLLALMALKSELLETAQQP
ncbi:hypothetical protein [Methylobacterium oxalidis]|uniref:hypothetical protein n=1 Tax=Methylobacterium oxalidis TaxID=944322 RepID=UPI001EDF0063|nr:hypothetical protein [Methylobacterium oxalidis]